MRAPIRALMRNSVPGPIGTDAGCQLRTPGSISGAVAGSLTTARARAGGTGSTTVPATSRCDRDDPGRPTGAAAVSRPAARAPALRAALGARRDDPLPSPGARLLPPGASVAVVPPSSPTGCRRSSRSTPARAPAGTRSCGLVPAASSPAGTRPCGPVPSPRPVGPSPEGVRDQRGEPARTRRRHRRDHPDGPCAVASTGPRSEARASEIVPDSTPLTGNVPSSRRLPDRSAERPQVAPVAPTPPTARRISEGDSASRSFNPRGEHEGGGTDGTYVASSPRG